jgi:VWFA-related protein
MWGRTCSHPSSMRYVACGLVIAQLAFAQFKSSVPLVLAPTTVTDSKGSYVDGLQAEDLILYDNNVPQAIQLSWTANPISLVVAVQTSANSGAVIDKLGGSGILFAQLVAADAGETAVLTFSDEVKVHQPFTADPDAVTHALRMLRMEGNSARTLDALVEALRMLSERPASRRRIVLMIGEKRDRDSMAGLPDVVAMAQRLNAAVYWLTFSPFLEPFTVKPKTKEDLKPEAERIKMPKCAWCPGPDNTPVPFDAGPGNPIYAIGELARLAKPDLPAIFSRATGGRTLGFVKKSALESTIQTIGAEIHQQYIVSFEPKNGDAPQNPGAFHSIRVVVKGRGDLRVRTRAGYWALD